MKERCCHYCGHPLPETRLGVRLTPLKARIYDIVQRAGIDGISAQDLWDIVMRFAGLTDFTDWRIRPSRQRKMCE